MRLIRTFRWVALGAILMAPMTGCQTTPKPGARAAAANNEANAIPAATLQRAITWVQLTGGDLGAGGGFLIAAAPDKIARHDHEQALAAAQSGEESPAQIDQVHRTATADLNNDGFVTLDEVLAMARAGLNNDEIIDRLRRTGYVFHITPQQERYLTDRGVTEKVVAVLHDLSHPS